METDNFWLGYIVALFSIYGLAWLAYNDAAVALVVSFVR